MNTGNVNIKDHIKMSKHKSWFLWELGAPEKKTTKNKRIQQFSEM